MLNICVLSKDDNLWPHYLLLLVHKRVKCENICIENTMCGVAYLNWLIWCNTLLGITYPSDKLIQHI